MSKKPLAITHPTIAVEAHGWDAKEVTYGSHKIREWKCPLGHVYKAAIFNRAMSGTSCPYCSGNKLLSGFNDLATKFPIIALEAKHWDPTQILAFANTKKEWRCNLGHEWETKVSTRTFRNLGCPFCGHKKLLSGFNDLATLYPDFALEAYGWDPSKVMAGNTEVRKWRCRKHKDHFWQARPVNRVFQNQHCPICSGRVVKSGFNDLKTTHPEIADEADGWNPTKISAGHKTRLAWKCIEGHSWKQTPNARTNESNFTLRSKYLGCPSCAKSGFDPNKDGYLYFLEHLDWDMFQIGITNSPSKRLNDHRRNGWKVLEIRGPMKGHLTRDWETSILRFLKEEGVDLANSSIAGRFDGYSESWSKSLFNANSLLELIEKVRNKEGKLENTITKQRRNPAKE